VRRAMVLFLAAAAGGAAGWTQEAKNTHKPLAPMVGRALGDMGKDAVMPPTLANLLGLTANRESVAVKQVAANIKGTDMIGFNVSTRDHQVIVIFRETPTVRSYFLTAPDGVLRKVIETRKPANGTGDFETSELRPATVEKRFEKERQCWIDVAQTSTVAPSCYSAAN
jgi:hypothetical protein